MKTKNEHKNASKRREYLSSIFLKIRGRSQWDKVLQDLFTPSEIETVSERIQIVEALLDGKTQRKIAREIGVSLFRVTHAVRVLKQQAGGFNYLVPKK